MAATSPKQCTGNQVDATTGMLFLEKNASMEPGKGRKGHIRNSWMYFTKLVPTVSTHIHHTPAYFLLYSNYYYCNKYSNLSILSNPCVCAQMLQKRWEQSCVHDHVPAGNQTWQHGNEKNTIYRWFSIWMPMYRFQITKSYFHMVSIWYSIIN